MDADERHAGAGRRIDDAAEARAERALRLRRRRLGFAIGGFLVGAVLLAVVGVLAGAEGYAIGQIGLAGSGVGLLMGLTFAGAIEDGEVQRASDRARGSRSGPADR